jgi:hypothetical protein
MEPKLKLSILGIHALLSQAAGCGLFLLDTGMLFKLAMTFLNLLRGALLWLTSQLFWVFAFILRFHLAHSRILLA